MIRKLTPEDLDAVMHIWLSSNLEAHSFVPAAYWHGHFEQVRAVLPTAAVYVHEEPAGHVDGFIGLFGDGIAGLFVEQAARSKGVGKYLLDHVKARRAHLQLQVYQKTGVRWPFICGKASGFRPGRRMRTRARRPM